MIKGGPDDMRILITRGADIVNLHCYFVFSLSIGTTDAVFFRLILYIGHGSQYAGPGSCFDNPRA